MWKEIGCTIIATRAATFDQLTNHYLADHPDATVLHVGCGMDSRVFRVDPPANVQWFDVDYPDVIDLRRQLFPERGASYHLIGAPLDDLRWLDEVPRDRPGLFIAEGVLHYLSETEVKALLNAVVAHFPGGQMIFDICNSMIVKRTGSNVGGTGATYKWGLDDPQDIQQLEPKLELIKEFRPSEQVAFSRFPLWWRALYRVQEVVPTLRRMERTDSLPLLGRKLGITIMSSVKRKNLRQSREIISHLPPVKRKIADRLGIIAVGCQTGIGCHDRRRS